VDATTALRSGLRVFLRKHGYRARGLRYNKSVGDGLVHVIQLQIEAEGDPGMDDRVDLFAVNLGVFIPEVEAFLLGYRLLAGGFVDEAACHIRRRLENPQALDDEEWFELRGEPSEVSITVDLLELDGLPFLSRFTSREALVREWERHGELPGLVSGSVWSLWMGIVFAQAGEGERARHCLEEALRGSSSHRPFAEVVRRSARRLGIEI